MTQERAEIAQEIAVLKARTARARAIRAKLLDALPVGIIETNRWGDVVMVNAVAARQLGTPNIDTLIGGALGDLFWPEDRRREVAENYAVRAGADLPTDEKRVRVGRREALFRTTRRALRGRDGVITGTLTCRQELEEDRDRAAEILDFQQRYELVLQASSQPILVLDRDLRIVEANPAAVTAFGWRHQVRGERLSELMPTAPRAPTTRFTLEPTEERPAWYRGALVKLSEYGYVLVAQEDLARLGAEELAIQAELRHAQRLASIGRLGSGVAREFCDLLTAILLRTARAMEQTSSERLRVGFDIVDSAARRGAMLTRQLLSFDREQGASSHVVEIESALRDLTPLLDRLAGPEIEVRVHMNSPARVQLQLTQLEQVIVNLVANARDAIVDRGLISIDGRIEDDEVVISVTDDGVGIDPDDLVHIFDRFVTKKSAETASTGLGLATVYGVADDSGGRVEVESVQGEGSVFRVVFPLSEQDATEPPPAPVGDATDVADARVAVVERDEDVRELVRLTLMGAGYVVAAAPDRESLTEPYDVIVADQRDVELERAARTEGERLRAVVVDGLVEESGTLLSKPYSREDLLSAVREALRSAS